MDQIFEKLQLLFATALYRTTLPEISTKPVNMRTGMRSGRTAPQDSEQEVRPLIRKYDRIFIPDNGTHPPRYDPPKKSLGPA